MSRARRAAVGYGLAMMIVFVASTVVVGASMQMMMGPVSAAYMGAASRDNMAANQLAFSGMKQAIKDLQAKYDAGTTITTAYTFSSASAPSSVKMPQSPSIPTTLDKIVGSYTASIISVRGNQIVLSVNATVGLGTYQLKKLVILSYNNLNPLDNVSGVTLTAAYGLRKLLSAYSGSAIRVRRSSDNTEQDIGFTTNGLLDVTALNTFLAGSGGANPASASPLDDVTGAGAAFSLRKLRAAYAGSAIRVRRSSDNTEQDIGFNGSGNLDTSALLTFVGAGNNGYVSKWYDQSTNARDAVQATTANQPMIVNAGAVETQNGRPSVHFVGASSTYLTLPSSPLNAADGTFIGVIKSNSAGWHRVFDFNNVAGVNLFYATLGNVRVNTGGGETGLSGMSVSSFGLYEFVRSAGTAYGYRNGTYYTSASMNALNGVSFSNNYLGKSAYADPYYDGYQSELFFYPTALSNANRQTLEISSSAYFQNQSTDYSDVTAYANDKPLDDVGSAAQAFGLRKLRTAYAGSAINVRRSSDNATQDIGFDGSGNLDTAALLTFVGANNGYVATWYDQSGNATNATQATAAYQPSIVLSGVVNKVNNMPSIKFDGVDDRMTVSRTIGDDFSILACYSAIAGATASTNAWYNHAGIVDMETGGVVNDFGTSLDNLGGLHAGVGAPDTSILAPSPGYNDQLMHRYTFTRNKTTGAFKLYVEKKPVVSGSNTNYNTLNANSTFTLGARNTLGYFLSGYINEVITYPSVLTSTNRRTVEYNQMTYYNIVDPATSTGYITRWYDQSPNGYDLKQLMPSLQPTYTWNVSISRPMITFDGASTYMNTDTVLNYTGNTLTAFGVANLTSTSNSFGRLFTSKSNASSVDCNTSSAALFFYNAGTSLSGYRVGGTSNKALTVNQMFQATSYFDGTNHTMRLNRVAGSTVASSGNFAINQLLAGSTPQLGGSEFWSGTASELILYAGVPTTAQLQILENNERAFYSTP